MSSATPKFNYEVGRIYLMADGTVRECVIVGNRHFGDNSGSLKVVGGSINGIYGPDGVLCGDMHANKYVIKEIRP